MIDPFVILAPILLLAVIALLRFVGCASILGVDDVAYTTTAPRMISFLGNTKAATKAPLPDGSGSATTPEMDTRGTPTSKTSLIVIATADFKPSATDMTSVTDSRHNSWTRLNPSSSPQNTTIMTIWYAANPNTDKFHTFTASGHFVS